MSDPLSASLANIVPTDELIASGGRRDQDKLDRLSGRVDSVSTARQARKVATEFEALFLSQVLEQLFAGIDSDPLFGGGQAEEVYRSFMNEEYGRILSQRGGVGLADQLYEEILRRNGIRDDEARTPQESVVSDGPDAVSGRTGSAGATQNPGLLEAQEGSRFTQELSERQSAVAAQHYDAAHDLLRQGSLR